MSKKAKKNLKNTSENNSRLPEKKEHGGDRVGAGRKKKEIKSSFAGFKVPDMLLEEINGGKIKNKSAFVSFLIAKELANLTTDEEKRAKYKEIAKEMKKAIY